MKNIMSQYTRKIVLALAILLTLALFGSFSQAQAHSYGEGRNGYWNRQGYHQYGYRHSHRGYWQHRDNGVRFWINVG